jgi:hypothetical protein
MLIIGCDFHTRHQQIAIAREETGELLIERRLDHERQFAGARARGDLRLRGRFTVCAMEGATSPRSGHSSRGATQRAF